MPTWKVNIFPSFSSALQYEFTEKRLKMVIYIWHEGILILYKHFKNTTPVTRFSERTWVLSIGKCIIGFYTIYSSH